MVKSSLEIGLEKMAKNLGSDLFGVADLTDAHNFICDQGGDYLKNFPRAISIGIHLLDAVIDELYRHEEIAVIHSYRGLYNSVNSCLDNIALQLAKRIQKEGHNAYLVSSAQTIDYNKLIGVISHKLVANLAGLGWIGKSCLLINPKYGPRVRFATILTDAPLKTGSQMAGKCNDCSKCVDICPVKAFTGIPFNPMEPREVRFKAHFCKNYMDKRKEKLGEALCGLCVYVCPFSRVN